MNKFYLFSLLTTVLYANNQEELIMDIEKSLIAVCCWSGTVYDHGNSDMETVIASMVQSGNTKSDIMNHFVYQYGVRVLAIPVMSGFNILAWIVPILIGLIGILIWYLYLNSPSTIVKPIKNEYNDISNIDEIEQELKDME